LSERQAIPTPPRLSFALVVAAQIDKMGYRHPDYPKALKLGG